MDLKNKAHLRGTALSGTTLNEATLSRAVVPKGQLSQLSKFAILSRHYFKQPTGSRNIQLPPTDISDKHRSAKQALNKNKAKNKQAKSYGSIGNLEVRLASRKREVKKAQRLRYNVFYKEMSAIPDMKTKMKRRDIDAYDKVCDHLLVLDHDYKSKKFPFAPKSKIIGTYRILTEEMANHNGGFYTKGEYDITPMLERHKETHKFLELGRSCVLKPYRSKRSVELLWRGLWAYIRENKANVMIGCASFEGIDPKAHALALSFLHHHAAAPEEWHVKAHQERYVDMNMMAKEEIDMKKALKALPPLIKGYLRLGAYIGEGAVIDHQFGTTDIMIILPTANIQDRYLTHFGTEQETTSRLTSEKLN